MERGFEARLQSGDVSFEPSDAALLSAVEEHRSLNAAADHLGRSFSRAHGRIKTLEEAFGELVERKRGGKGGGGSELTGNARELLARFDRLQTAFAGTAGVEKTVLSGTVIDRSGELATVETDAGTVRAVFPGAPETQQTAVDLSLRADSVTLYTPGGDPSTAKMSARNRFRGTVVEIDRGESIAVIAVDIGAGKPLLALVTTETLEAFETEPGDELIASFKATATRATPRLMEST